MKTIYLVSCVKVKLDHGAPARDLYQSLWFKSARAFVESRKAEWYILSALYGLVSPDQFIKPYEATLNTMKADDRRLWAKITAQHVSRQIKPQHITVLAGSKYREFLLPLLERKGFIWETPLARLGIGSQVRWLQNHATLVRSS